MNRFLNDLASRSLRYFGQSMAAARRELPKTYEVRKSEDWFVYFCGVKVANVKTTRVFHMQACCYQYNTVFSPIEPPGGKG